MLGIPLRYLLRHPSGVADLAADPRQVWTMVQDYYVAQQEQSRPQCPYEADKAWEEQLHQLFGLPRPCEAASEFWELWPQVIADLEGKGVRAGPESFLDSNDGDAGLVRAVWCLVRHMKTRIVVETGVAHGVTSRCILEAVERNGDGHLWSIDLPPLEMNWREQVGIAVDERFADRWTYIKGSSRLRLPQLLSSLRQIDLFIHDSLHTERNVLFELDSAWAVLRPGGALVVDDVDANWGFQRFTQAHCEHPSMICEAEPLRPDLRRFNKKGLFGIVLKSSAVH